MGAQRFSRCWACSDQACRVQSRLPASNHFHLAWWERAVYCNSARLRGFLNWSLLHRGTRWLEIIWRCKSRWVFGLAAVSAVSAKRWNRLCVEQACSEQPLFEVIGTDPRGRGVACAIKHSWFFFPASMASAGANEPAGSVFVTRRGGKADPCVVPSPGMPKICFYRSMFIMNCARKHMACSSHEWEVCMGPCAHREPREDKEQTLACVTCSLAACILQAAADGEEEVGSRY